MNAKRIEEIEMMSLEQLKEEAIELLGAASNEKIWMHGSSDAESQIMHHNNREDILEEYRFVKSLIEKIEISAKKITPQQLKEAQEVIIRYFFQENQNVTRKPITMLDTDVDINNEHFRLFSFLTFYGRDELPKIDLDEKENK